MTILFPSLRGAAGDEAIQFRRLSRFGALICSAIIFFLTGCNALPWLEYRVRLPDGFTLVRIMIRSGGEYRTIVENPWGSASDSHLPIAGAHRRTNLYLTPDHELVTIEAGGDDARFDISPERPPKLVGIKPVRHPSSNRQREAMLRKRDEDSYRWRYIGMVYRGSGGSFAYHSPKDIAECISLLGAGRSFYRTRYQQKHFCPELPSRKPQP